MASYQPETITHISRHKEYTLLRTTDFKGSIHVVVLTRKHETKKLKQGEIVHVLNGIQLRVPHYHPPHIRIDHNTMKRELINGWNRLKKVMNLESHQFQLKILYILARIQILHYVDRRNRNALHMSIQPYRPCAHITTWALSGKRRQPDLSLLMSKSIHIISSAVI